MRFSLRPLRVALLGLLALAAPAFADPAQNGPWLHATSLIGQPKYPEGFKHYDYVNPDAPKGGLARLSNMGGFDTFNPILPKGEAADGLGLVFESLMDRSLDEASKGRRRERHPPRVAGGRLGEWTREQP